MRLTTSTSLRMFSVAQKWVSLYFAPVPRPEIQSYITTYEYSGLLRSTKSFRVFRLFPQRPEDLAQGNDLSGPLRGRIEVISLTDSETCRYNALSYCWEGSIEPNPYLRHKKDRVIIEAKDGSSSQIVISPALSIALRFIRARGESLPLFVDQICINQRDNMDKNQQVSLMGDIYSNCDCVLAWIDVATKESDELFNFLPRISNNDLLLQLVRDPKRFIAIFSAFKARNVDSGEWTLKQDVKDMVNLCREHCDRFPHYGFTDISLRRWFRRVWIIQEACLGPKMTFLCGNRSCSIEAVETLDLFRRLVNQFDEWEIIGPESRSPNRQARRAKPPGANRSGEVISRILQERAGAQVQPGETRTQGIHRFLQNLVVRFNVDRMAHGPWFRAGSSNPRDNIYALQGLVPRGDKKLVTNYELPIPAIFTELTRVCFDTSQRPLASAIDMSPYALVDTLFLSKMDAKVVDELPTWVPDWSANLTIPHGYRVGGFPVFNAGGGNNPSLEPYCLPEVDISKPGILKIKAVLLCKVDNVGKHFMQFSSRQPVDKFDSPTIVARTIFNFFREVRDMCKWASFQPNSASIPSATELDKTVWITSTGGHGLMLTTEETLMGREPVNGKPLLGYLWDFQLEMDVLPTIMKRRRDHLKRITVTWTSNTRPSSGGHLGFLWRLCALFLYWVGRVVAEMYHLYWMWRYACGWIALLILGRDNEDMIYAGIFGLQWKVDIGTLKFVLAKHVGRKCFASDAGHVGLGPVGMELGDVVVVPLAATLPVILRPGATATEPWRYVGEAYCHGFMYGEALAEGNGLETKYFEIA